MTAITAARFTAARVQGRYRVLDEAGQIVVTLNSKAKAEARAAELNTEAAMAAAVEAPLTEAEAEFLAEQDAKTAEVDAAWTAQEQAMAEGRIADVLIGEAIGEAVAESMTAAAAAQEPQEAPAQGAGTSDTPAQQEEPQGAQEGPSPEAVAKAAKALQAELTANAEAIGKVLDEPLPGEATPAKRTPKPAAAKAGQPAPHAFTTVGTKIKNHCTDCGRSWAAAAHRKFREEQGGTPVAAEAEWTPAADDTTEDGKAPAESAQG